MRPLNKDQLFNSNELNKILPSYLIDEIDEEEKDQNNNISKTLNKMISQNESKNVRKIYKN